MNDKLIKFKAVYSISEIQEVEILSQTDSFVSFKGWNGKIQREAKSSKYYTYHDTKQEAKGDLLARLFKRSHTFNSQLKSIESEIEKVKLL